MPGVQVRTLSPYLLISKSVKIDIGIANLGIS